MHIKNHRIYFQTQFIQHCSMCKERKREKIEKMFYDSIKDIELWVCENGPIRYSFMNFKNDNVFFLFHNF